MGTNRYNDHTSGHGPSGSQTARRKSNRHKERCQTNGTARRPDTLMWLAFPYAPVWTIKGAGGGEFRSLADGVLVAPPDYVRALIALWWHYKNCGADADLYRRNISSELDRIARRS